MNTFIVDKDIPVPQRSYAGSSIVLPGWEIGDSFVVESKSKASYLSSLFRKRGQKVTCRQIEGGKFRIWRTA